MFLDQKSQQMLARDKKGRHEMLLDQKSQQVLSYDKLMVGGINKFNLGMRNCLSVRDWLI